MAPTLAHFDLRERIGLGAMGAVYRAKDERLGRTVAVKILLPEVNEDEERRSRFLREARAAAGLNHPNIAMIFEVGEVRLAGEEIAALGLEGVPDQPAVDLPFFAMEHVPGEDLGTLLEREAPLEVEQVIDLGRQIAGALEAAHRAGIVHRDLKPGNVRVTPEGRAKLLDFGLAKLLSRESGRTVDSGTGSQLTLDGMVMGTLPYLAPEQLQGLKIDGRADLFALGVLLYEMTTGEAPFPSESMVEYARALLARDSRRPRELRPDLPQWLDELVMKLLDTDPSRRPMSAAVVRMELEEQLSAFREPSGTTTSLSEIVSLRSERAARRAHERRSPRRLSAFVLTAAVVLVVILAGFVVAWRLDDRRGPPPRLVPGPPSVAVLPPWSPGESPPVIQGLAIYLEQRFERIPGMVVRPVEDVLLYADAAAGEAALGRSLKADFVLGLALVRSDALELRLRWLRSADGVELWTRDLDIGGDAVLALQGPTIAEILDGNPSLPPFQGDEPMTASRTAFRSHLVGLARLHGPQPENALSAFERALAEDPKFWRGWLGVAEARVARVAPPGDEGGEAPLLAPPPPARDLATARREELPWTGAGRTAESERAAAHLEAARRALGKASELLSSGQVSSGQVSSHPSLFRLRAHLEIAAGRHQAALAAVRGWLALQPADPDGLALEGRLLARLGRPEEARRALEEAVRRDPGSWRHRTDLGRLLLAQGRLEAAATQLAEADRLSPERISVARRYRAETLFRLGRPAEVIAVQRSSPVPVDRPLLARYLGLSHLALGDLEKARSVLGLAVELDRDNPDRWYDLGQLYLDLGREDFARASFDQARQIWEDRVRDQPEDVVAASWHRFFQAKRGRCREALDALGDREVSPEQALLDARTLAVCGRFEAAEERVGRALELGLAPERLFDFAELQRLDVERPRTPSGTEI